VEQTDWTYLHLQGTTALTELATTNQVERGLGRLMTNAKKRHGVVQCEGGNLVEMGVELPNHHDLTALQDHCDMWHQ
jgi:hypothetical protein